MTALLSQHGAKLAVFAALAAIAVIAAIAGLYLAYPGYVDHTEPSIAALSWRLFEGHPVYHGLEAPDRTSIPYGPLAYGIHAVIFALFGGSLATGKLAGLAAAMFVPLFFLIGWRRWGLVHASAASLLASGFILLLIPFSIWNRPDPFIVLFVVIALWVMNSADKEKPEWVRTLIIATAGGMAVSLKIHAGIYFVPIALLHCHGRGFTRFLALSLAGAAVAMAPFAFSAFSLADYTVWFSLQAAGKAFSPEAYGPVLKKALLYLIPALVFFPALKSTGKGGKIYFWSYMVSLLVLIPLAARPGGGHYYLYPFFPLAIDLTLRFAGNSRYARFSTTTLLVAAVFVLMLSVPVQKRFLRNLDWTLATSIDAEVKDIIAHFSGKTIEMGYGEKTAGGASYDLTYYKSLLVMAGNPYSLDATVGAEMLKLGIAFPKAAIERIGACRTDLWLVPKGEAPFAMWSYYGGPAFPEVFRQAFLGAYKKSASFTYFDVWACRE